jgi:hypothetical protein
LAISILLVAELHSVSSQFPEKVDSSHLKLPRVCVSPAPRPAHENDRRYPRRPFLGTVRNNSTPDTTTSSDRRSLELNQISNHLLLVDVSLTASAAAGSCFDALKIG